jgi:hypothetical protein
VACSNCEPRGRGAASDVRPLREGCVTHAIHTMESVHSFAERLKRRHRYDGCINR